MCIPRDGSGFKVPGSKFRLQGSGSKTHACSFAKNNSELGTRNLERQKSLGLSLIELIMFIVMVSVVIAGILPALEGDRALRSAGPDRLPRFE